MRWFTGKPKRPPGLTLDDERELERVGDDGVKILLSSSPRTYLYQTHGPQFVHAQAWVRWKAEQKTWKKEVASFVGVALAILGILVAFLAWLFPKLPST